MVRKDNSAEKKQPVIFQICCEVAAGEGGVESDPGFGACSNLRRRLRGDPTAAGDGGSSHAPGRRAERRPSLQFQQRRTRAAPSVCRPGAAVAGRREPRVPGLREPRQQEEKGGGTTSPSRLAHAADILRSCLN